MKTIKDDDEEEVPENLSLRNLMIIMRLIWKYLSLEDKLNSRLVCKRFKQIIDGNDDFTTNLYFPSKVLNIPKLTTNHERATIEDFLYFSYLNTEDFQYLEQSSQSLIYLKLKHNQFYLRELYELLKKFPLLETLEIEWIDLITKTSIILTNEDLTKLLSFKNPAIKFHFQNDFVDKTRNILKIEMRSRIKGKKFNVSKYKATNSINLMKCIINEMDVDYIVISLKSNTGITPINDNIIFYLKHLDRVKLHNANHEMKNILKSKFIDELQGLAVNYTTEEKNIVFEEIQRLLEESGLVGVDEEALRLNK